MARHKQSVRVSTTATQDRVLVALSHLVRLGFNFAYDNRLRLWNAEQAFQSNYELQARLVEVPTLAALAKRKSDNTLWNIITSDAGLSVAHQCVGVGVERCRDSFARYSRSSSTKACNPRRKNSGEYPSVQFPARDCVLGVGFVEVPVIGVLKSRVKSHDFRGDSPAKTITIKRVALGKWDISVSYQPTTNSTVHHGEGVIGIDINTSNTCGIWYIGADGEEDGFVYPLPDTTKAERDIRYHRERLANCRGTGKRRHEFERLLDTAIRHRQNIIKEHHLVIIRFLVSLNAQVIAFEEFDLRDGGYGGWKKVAVNQIRRALIDRKRGDDNGCKVVTVNRAYTTQDCSDCGHRQPMPSEVRDYICPKCEMKMNRDLNSARNIARRYLTSCSPSMVGTTRR